MDLQQVAKIATAAAAAATAVRRPKVSEYLHIQKRGDHEGCGIAWLRTRLESSLIMAETWTDRFMCRHVML